MKPKIIPLDKFVIFTIVIFLIGSSIDNITTYLIFSTNYDYAIEHELNKQVVEMVKEKGILSLLVIDQTTFLTNSIAFIFAGMVAYLWFPSILGYSFKRNFLYNILIFFCFGIQIISLIRIGYGLNNLGISFLI